MHIPYRRGDGAGQVVLKKAQEPETAEFEKFDRNTPDFFYDMGI